ncbi:hypothetical protein FRC09_002854 [Ceratobasidium sp. 395]|nr:hypothetical protein FRC09_002854 [Ceratobasidium sp. 395]
MLYRLYTDASEACLAGILQQVQPVTFEQMKGTRVYERGKKAFLAKEPIPRFCTPTDVDKDVVAGGDKEWNSQNWEKTTILVERVIAYWSRILQPAERNYSATEREALALKEALVKFQVYLEGAKLAAVTEHAALTWSRTFQHINQRLLKWGLIYQPYPGMSIIHRAGRVHDNADSLSRILYCIPKSDNPNPPELEPLKLSIDEDAIKSLYKDLSPTFEAEVKAVVSKHIISNLDEYLPTPSTVCQKIEIDGQPLFDYELSASYNLIASIDYEMSASYNLIASIDSTEVSRFISAYENDKHFSKIIHDIRKSHLVSPYPQYYIEDNGLLYFTGNEGNPQLCAPSSIRQDILAEAHDLPSEGAHPGYARMYNRVREIYYWLKLEKDVNKYAAECPICQKTKPDRLGKKGFLHPIPIPDQPFKVVTMDFIMDLPESEGYNGILVVVDKLTRYTHFIPCNTSVNETQTARLFQEHIWSHYGLPRQVITDRDSRWTGAFWDHLTSIIGIKRALTTSHHPQADGQTEIMNQTLEVMIRAYISSTKDNWKTLLPALAFSYDTSVHSTTKYTPAFLLRGFEPLRPSNLLSELLHHVPRIESESAQNFSEEMKAARNLAKDAIRIAQVHQSKQYNSNRCFEAFQPGDEALINLKTLRLSERGKGRKLDQIYDGPFKVMEQISLVTYHLRFPDDYPQHPIINISHLVLYRRPTQEFEDCPDLPPYRVQENTPEIFEVEKIVDEGFAKRQKRRVKLYKVRWTGYGPEEDCWLTAKELCNAPDILKQWDKQKQSAKPFGESPSS